MRLRLLLGFLFSSLKSCNSVSFSFNVFIVGKAFQLLKSITEETIREKKKKTNKSIDTESRRWENMDGDTSGDGDYTELKCVRKAFHM